MDLAERFLAQPALDDLVPRAARVLVAVSGGGDSIALLHLLASAAPGKGWTVEAVCVDHRTRPGTADEARFVAEVCAGLGVPFHAVALPGESAASSEDALRRARREALAAAARARGASRVALGHQADDVIETMAMRLLRGAGLDGLGGIPPRTGGFVRPLLPFRRAELRRWLETRGLAWVEDPTNEDVRKLRARVRHLVLPALRRFSPAIDEGLLAAAGAIQRARELLEVWDAGWLADRAVTTADGLELPRAALREEPPVSRGRLIRRAAERLGLARRRLGRACLEEVLGVLERGAPGAAAPLPCGLEAACEGDVLRLRRKGLARERDGV
ncbi:MAG: tRNA lysidine(34) synthetase TilS [Deltaproteobacteria bacterium]|nr:tRNA lysidine(34) synthetase TilS [Deltaproteobacteria bacterium]